MKHCNMLHMLQTRTVAPLLNLIKMQVELGQSPKRKVAPYLKNSNFAIDTEK
jgi:hypothetical protein